VPGLRANKRAVLDTRDITGMRASQVAAWAQLFVQLRERAALDHELAEHLIFLLRAVAPEDAVGLAEFGHLLHPGESGLVGRFTGSEFRFRHRSVQVQRSSRVAKAT